MQSGNDKCVIRFQFTFYVCLFFSGKSSNYFFFFSIINKCYWKYSTPAFASYSSFYNINQTFFGVFPVAAKNTPIVINPNNNRRYSAGYPVAVSNTPTTIYKCYNIIQAFSEDFLVAVSNTLIFINSSNCSINPIFSRNFIFVGSK